MVPDTSTTATAERSTETATADTVIYGLVGGIAGIVLAFIPLSPAIGGAIAGYLNGGRPKDGLAAGAVAGGVMIVPFALALFFVLFVLGLGGAPSAFGVLGLFVLLASGLYAVGLSVIGGYLGRHLKAGR